MMPGSHKQGMREQVLTDDSDNILFLGQTIEEVSEDKAVLCPLGPGEVSLHHGWTMHSSTPNESSDRRIGLNIQYIKPSMRQQNLQSDSALLICGKDCYGHYDPDTPASDQIPADAVERFAKLTEKYFQIADVQIENDLSRLGRWIFSSFAVSNRVENPITKSEGLVEILNSFGRAADKESADQLSI